ncbi:ABC transporter ATP-binding protein [Microbacterium sp. NPDC089696]|uniref:ABC transporter ATP-binding protein n=1 Tax=Microbacterium sp. NPDC089696 TaxID=3364199 RepID=UPI00382C3851
MTEALIDDAEKTSSGPTKDAESTPRLHAEDVTIGYDGRVVSEHLDVEIPPGSFTVVVGPNACGKSTLLRAFARLLKPRAGRVLLDGRAIAELPTKDVARRLGLLPQTSIAPDGIRVSDLVARGRHPHQTILRQWSHEDQTAVAAALDATGTTELAGRLVDELSGGQRQRVWVAMLLAQESPTMLLDEPTTFLDIAHQYDLLRLFHRLHREGRTVVAVLHDLNQAARFADHMVMMRDGRVVASGAPASIVTAERVHEVFGLDCTVIADPHSGTPLVVPR